MSINAQRLRDHLSSLDFKELFNELGWEQPTRRSLPTNGTAFNQRLIAELAGVAVLEVTLPNGTLPDAKMRRTIYDQIVQQHNENLLIFLDSQRTQSLWYWVKRDGTKRYPREHWYFKGQPGDLFLSKLRSMVVDISEFETPGQLTVVDAALRLQQALDVEPVTKKFYNAFKEQHVEFLQYIQGIDDERDRRWYASVLLNRLMFIYFLQRKAFLNNDTLYLRTKLEESSTRGGNRYYSEFLEALFFEGFAKPEDKRTERAAALIGTIPYLNGGLFLKHRIELDYPNISIPDEAFHNLLTLFAGYSWNLDDTPGGDDNELNPDVLGYIFEKYINQKAFGAYYTRTEITDYLCEQTINRLILDRINVTAVAGKPARNFESLPDLLTHLDTRLCRDLLDILPTITLLDPACGSGAFLVAAMKTLINIYSVVTGKVEYLNDPSLNVQLEGIRSQGRSLSYTIKKQIIVNNLYGVDIMEEATEIAKLRLFLALVSSAYSVDQLEPLPNIDFNILPGNSLIGLREVNPDRLPVLAATGSKEAAFQRQLDEKNKRIAMYRDTTKRIDDPVALQRLREEIQQLRIAAQHDLDVILLEDFFDLGVRYEQATWNPGKNKEDKPIKRAIRADDIAALHPFHWGYEFDQIMARGGFDAIITNPPWEILKPQAKEFFQQHSALVTKKKMTIKQFEEAQATLLKDPEIRDAWLSYLSQYPHVSAFYRAAPQYINQIAVINGKRAGTDINLYKLFVEQCHNLLRAGGQCGIIIPSGIYTDLGTKQLREMLFAASEIRTLFGLSNEKFIFEGVHHSFKVCILVFAKSGYTETFTGAFRINPREAVAPDKLEIFLHSEAQHVELNVPLIRLLSPDSLSVMEFKSDVDVQIAKKMLHFPLLSQQKEASWNVRFAREFDMTNDSELFKIVPQLGRLPLYEGKMIHQFTNHWGVPRYWVDQAEGRKALLGRVVDTGQKLDYQGYRVGYRAIARNTDSRTMIASVLPQAVFYGHSLNATSGQIEPRYLLYLTALLNSFVLDFALRQRVSANLTMFFIYQLPVPRLTEFDPHFRPIVERAAKLICTSTEFDELAQQVGFVNHTAGVTDIVERAKLRAELDGMIAHLYELTEQEFSHVLGTFPLSEQSSKDAALRAYRVFAPNPDDQQLAAIITKGENAQVEFKAAALINHHTGQKDGTMAANIVQAVASYLNSSAGGALVIGAKDDGTLNDLRPDYQAANAQKNNRDGYALWLSDTLGNQLGNQFMPYWTITFHAINGQEVCRIAIKPAPQPVYLKNGDFYVRGDQGKKKLTVPEAITYIKQRWS